METTERPQRGGLSGLFSGLFFGDAPTHREQDDALARAKIQHEQRSKDLEYWKGIRERIDGAYSEFRGEDDGPLRKSALELILGEVENRMGKKLSPVVRNIFKGDPNDIKEIIAAATEAGMTMEQLFMGATEGNLPVADALIAFGRRRREGKVASAGGGMEPGAPAPTAEQPPVEGATPAPAAAEVPTTRNDAIQRRIAFLRQQRAQVLSGESDARRVTALTKGIDEELARLETEASKLGTERTLTIETEGRQPADNKAVDEARIDAVSAGMSQAAARRAFSYGMTRQQLTDRQNNLRALTGGTAAEPAAGAGASPAAPTPTPAPGQRPQPSTALTKDQRDFEDSLTKLAAETDARKRVAAFEAATTSSFKTLDEIKGIGQRARNSADSLGVLAAAALRLGPSGEWITPVRNLVDNAAGLLGVQNLVGKSAREVITGLNARLATEITAMQKGQQSDKELSLALASSPGAMNTNKGLAIMAFVASELAKKQQSYEMEARAWAARHLDKGGLDAVDDKGRSFQEVWEAKMRNYNKANGSLSERTARAFEVKHDQLLKGLVKDAR